MPTGTCPDCGADILVDADADVGDQLSCDECATVVQIIGLVPVAFEVPDEETGGNAERS